MLAINCKFFRLFEYSNRTYILSEWQRNVVCPTVTSTGLGLLPLQFHVLFLLIITMTLRTVLFIYLAPKSYTRKIIVNQSVFF